VRTLTVYTKRDCHLCDEALALLSRLEPELGFVVDEVDIGTDEELFRRYRNDVPVLALDGEVLLSAPLAERDVRRVLARSLSS
jgi:glutaredoxin